MNKAKHILLAWLMAMFAISVYSQGGETETLYTMTLNISQGTVSGSNTWTSSSSTSPTVTFKVRETTKKYISKNGDILLLIPDWWYKVGFLQYDFNSSDETYYDFALEGDYAIKKIEMDVEIDNHLIYGFATIQSVAGTLILGNNAIFGLPYQAHISIDNVYNQSTFLKISSGRSTSLSKPELHISNLEITYGIIQRNVNYKVSYTDGNNVTRTLQETVDAIVGRAASLPQSLRRGFCDYGYDPTRITSGVTAVDATYTIRPSATFFEYSNADHPIYYNVKIYNTSGTAYYLYNNNSVSLRKDPTTNNKNSDAYLWRFEGNPYSTRIINKNGKYLAMNNNGNLVLQDALYEWNLFESNYASTGFTVRSSSNRYVRNSGSSLASTTESADIVLNGVFSKLRQNNDGNYLPDASYCMIAEENKDIASTVNYKLMVDGVRKAEYADYDVSASQLAGTTLHYPDNMRRPYCTYDYYQTENLSGKYADNYTIPTGSGVLTVWVNAVFNDVPFKRTQDNASPKWQYLTLNGKYVGAEGHAPSMLFEDLQVGPMYQWAFSGNSYDGFMIYNRWWGMDSNYTLCNTDNASVEDDFTFTMGPKMGTSGTVWNIVYRSDNEFGFTDKAKPAMNICDFDSRGRLGYDFQHAGFTPTAAMTTETSLTLEGVAETAAVLNTMTGNPFALTSEVSATATNETREILNTPESYVRQVAEGYYRLKLADGSGKYLDCKSFEDREHDQAGCYYTITDNTMSAGTIFYLKQTSGGNSYIVSLEEMSSQGQPISSGTYTLYPFGGGKVALLVNGTDGVEDKYYNYSQGIDMMVMSAYYDEPTLYYLEKVETFDIKLNAISGDPYTYATLYLPFDVTLPDNTYAYMGAREGSGKIFCTKIAEPGDVLAAGTPVVIVNEAKETQVTLLLPNGSPIAEKADAGNLLLGQYFEFIVPGQDHPNYKEDEHDRYLAFGKGGSMNKPGFYPFVKETTKRVTDNKAYIFASKENEAKGMVLIELMPEGWEDSAPTSITDYEHLQDVDVYYTIDGQKLMGRPFGRGVFIKGKKKVMVNK
jgi:hypothetical protein